MLRNRENRAKLTGKNFPGKTFRDIGKTRTKSLTDQNSIT